MIRPLLSASRTIASACARLMRRSEARNAHWSGCGSKCSIQKDAVAPRPRLLLQRQRDQVAEAAFGQACPGWERAGHTNRSPISGRCSIVSVRRCEPRLRARRAGTASAKNSQTCPPSPERERSSAAGRSRSPARFQKRRRIRLPGLPVEIHRQEIDRSHPAASDKRP